MSSSARVTRLSIGALCVCSFLAWSGLAFAQASPTVTTDKVEYMPGETVMMTGAGWQAGETVSLVLHEVPTFHPDPTFTVVAGANGGWINTEFIVLEEDMGTTFTLTATGQSSGATATASFTEAIGTNMDQFQNGTPTKSP